MVRMRSRPARSGVMEAWELGQRCWAWDMARSPWSQPISINMAPLGAEIVLGLLNESANDGHSIGAAVQSESGFVMGDFTGKVGEFSGWDVGRVGYQDVDWSGEVGEEIAVEEGYTVLDVVSGGVFMGELEGVGGDVRGE